MQQSWVLGPNRPWLSIALLAGQPPRYLLAPVGYSPCQQQLQACRPCLMPATNPWLPHSPVILGSRRLSANI